MPIRVLPPHVSAMIAAGEVIERPASVVRELIDNALDAGATSIDVSISPGSFSRIVVGDNGVGMDYDDLCLCLQNHATSKLPLSDIFNVRTLGFRGEALPSMAAVANVFVVSRPVDQDVAFSVRAVGGVISKPMPSAGSFGTRVEVSNLFHEHPARQAFLKSRGRELAYIEEVIETAALAHPQVKFTYRADRSARVIPAHRDFQSRIKALYPDDLGRNAVAVSLAVGNHSFSGLVSMPTSMDKAGRGDFRFVVNGRVVADRHLLGAVQSVYKALTGTTEKPHGCIRIDLPPNEVNANVHPAKLEIHFRDQGTVLSELYAAVEQALAGSGLRSPGRLSELARKLTKVEANKINDPRRLPLGRYVGQMHSAWLLAETLDGIAIVDQHAAHERVLLERLKKASAGFPEELITLNPPYTTSVDAASAAAVHDTVDALSGLGLQVSVQERTIIILRIPAVLAHIRIDVLADLIISYSLSGMTAGLMGDALWESLATAACKAAIKAGDVLTPERGEQLLREIEATPNASQCNHGRPTVLFFTNEALSKMFERS